MVIDKIVHAEQIMQDFALRTGLIGSAKPKRYLWTDAFAVCNFLGLYEAQKDTRYLDLARKLVDQVHWTLGQWHPDEHRKGYISGLSETEAAKHPTVGGLRIGKPLPQRGEEEHYDERLEWDRDGQYFHYLTKWMHALNRMTELTGEYHYNIWAIELAKVAFAKFSYVEPKSGERLLFWKMSTDLSRPLVDTMGQHDALDGWIVYQKLQNVAKKNPHYNEKMDLSDEIAALRRMINHLPLTTADALGIGGLLNDTYFLAKLPSPDAVMLKKLFIASLQSIETFAKYDQSLTLPAERRLAFRELGLAIGIESIIRVDNLKEPFDKYRPIGEEIISFWGEESHQKNLTWQEHIDINTVMLATALAPDGYLGG
jgi:hypothetical protein